jgi:hypothetical protein
MSPMILPSLWSLSSDSSKYCMAIPHLGAVVILGWQSPGASPDEHGRNVRFWHLADNSVAPAFVRFWATADKGEF